ncbi:glycoside hydrolase family 88/105 protein [Paenibacillus caui]|uniref:glycoside hydrolase family 88/105 protein n=1 Tax=Paenibacillus caui TaxID=2873927 RepID=UPI001CA9C3B5|nr:glycoside hydrolase family 88 protein [Paenibacillus caui]
MQDAFILTDTLHRLFTYMTNEDGERDWGMDIEQWDWVPGVGLISIMEYGTTLKKQTAVHYVQEWVRRNEPKAGRMKVINAMAPFAVYPELYRQTHEELFLIKSWSIARWMLEEAPRTREQAFEHTVTEAASFREQVWADTVYMAVLFLARLAGLMGNRKLADEALRQTLIHMRLLQDAGTGISFHGWNCEAGHHMSKARWARANAWLVLAIPDIVSEIRGIADIPDELCARYERLAAGLRSRQAADGLWHTVVDRPDFYKETSASAGIACGYLKAVRTGLLDASYCQIASRTLNGVLPLITPEGEVKGGSGGTPVLATAEAYNEVPVYPTLYGQGLTMQLLAQTLAMQKSWDVQKKKLAGVQIQKLDGHQNAEEGDEACGSPADANP